MSDSELSAFDKAVASFECMTHEGREYHAVSNICPHQYAAVICDGLIEEGTVTCPLHGWIYSLDSGKALGSNARLKTYHVFELDGSIWLEKPEKLTPLWLRNF